MTAEVRASHADLSPADLDLLDYILADPESRARPLAPADLPAWVRGYPMQAWPFLLDARKVQEVERATVGVMRLARSVPERVFGNDPKRLAAYYRLGNELLASFLFAAPNGLEGAVGRGDFIAGRDGLKCVEINAGATSGGWQTRFWERQYRNSPMLAPFFAERGLQPAARDPWRILFLHVIGEARRGLSELSGQLSGELNVALVVPEALLASGMPALDEVFQAALDEAGGGLGGRLVFTTYPGSFALQGGHRLGHAGTPVQAVVECVYRNTPQDVYRSFKAGGILLYNGPLSRVLGDKRNLALLSEHAESDLFTAEERALIAAHIPWTRTVDDRAVTWEGEEEPLLALLRARRERFVIKPAAGSQGDGVVVGPRATPEAWERAVATAAAEPAAWLVQEVVASRPYLCQAGEVGVLPHDVVWGTFCFGDTYGGGFLRTQPRGLGDGVLNAARGAVEGFLFEV